MADEKGSTPTGGDPDQTEVVGQALNTRRLSAVDAIAAQRDQQFAAETGIAPEELSPPIVPETPEPAVTEQSAAAPDQGEQQGEQVAAALADDEGYVPPEMLSRKVKLKIDGQETDRTLEDLVRSAQKNGAADARLREATELLRILQAAKSAEKPAETVATIQPSPVQGPSPETVSRVKDALQAVFNGDEDAAAEKLAAMLTQPAPTAAPDINIDEVVEAAARRLDEKSALARFFAEYPKVAEHPYVQGRADELFRAYAEEGHDFQKSLMLAGEALYKEIGWQKRTSPEPNPTTDRRQDLVARKAALDTPSSRSVSAAPAVVTPESSEESRVSTIQEMAARRNPTIGALQKAAR